jgi:hypothetical protein
MVNESLGLCGLEMGVLLLVSIVVLVTHAGQLSLAPFNLANISVGPGRSWAWIPDSCLYVHRLGKLRIACRGNH